MLEKYDNNLHNLTTPFSKMRLAKMDFGVFSFLYWNTMYLPFQKSFKSRRERNKIRQVLKGLCKKKEVSALLTVKACSSNSNERHIYEWQEWTGKCILNILQLLCRVSNSQQRR